MYENVEFTFSDTLFCVIPGRAKSGLIMNPHVILWGTCPTHQILVSGRLSNYCSVSIVAQQTCRAATSYQWLAVSKPAVCFDQSVFVHTGVYPIPRQTLLFVIPYLIIFSFLPVPFFLLCRLVHTLVTNLEGETVTEQFIFGT